ncbi:MAG: MBOAT family protein [Ruminococcaceae bacterium]|nr:MBOAT family protein [Oscillospiraceae bacterium]
MVFSSLFFIFAFLVISYALYAAARGIRARNIILLVSSLIFYAWGGPAFVLLLCLETFVCYTSALVIERMGQKTRPALSATWVCAGFCLALLVLFKYTGFFLSIPHDLFGIPEIIPAITLPIGISFYTFQLLSYVIDVYRGEVEAQKSYTNLLLYASLFHQCIAGPIVRYADVACEIEQRSVSWSQAAQGVSRFAVGLAKKALLANGCAMIADKLLPGATTNPASLSAVSLLLGGLCYMLQIYLDFSAYSDMAIGMGLMVGFHYKENFNYPYTASSITDFWRRWHISLSTFFRDYVYIPLGGNRVKVPRHILNMLIVWGLTGFWHGASWNFILWGLYYFVWLILEKYVLRVGKQTPTISKIITRIWVLPAVYFGWLLFRFDDLSLLWTTLKGFVCANGNAFFDLTAQTQLSGNCIFLAISILACFPIVPLLAKLKDCKAAPVYYVANTVAAILPAVLLILSALALIGDSYNPFLYFRF